MDRICELRDLNALCDEDESSCEHKPFLLKSVVPALTRPFSQYICTEPLLCGGPQLFSGAEVWCISV